MNADHNWLGGTFLFLPLAVFAVMFLGVLLFIGLVIFKLIKSGGKAGGTNRPGHNRISPLTQDVSTPPLILGDSLTNPANPLYHHHHAHDQAAGVGTHSTQFDPGPSHHHSSPTDFGSASSSFDSSSTNTGSMDSGAASSGCSNP